jgi:hypothetical protein
MKLPIPPSPLLPDKTVAQQTKPNINKNMGGSNTRTKQPPVAYREEGQPPVSAQEEATIEKLLAQGMSGPADQSAANYGNMAMSAFSQLRSKASELSPNLFGRDVSAPAADESKNK